MSFCSNSRISNSTATFCKGQGPEQQRHLQSSSCQWMDGIRSLDVPSLSSAWRFSPLASFHLILHLWVSESEVHSIFFNPFSEAPLGICKVVSWRWLIQFYLSQKKAWCWFQNLCKSAQWGTCWSVSWNPSNILENLYYILYFSWISLKFYLINFTLIGRRKGENMACLFCLFSHGSL